MSSGSRSSSLSSLSSVDFEDDSILVNRRLPDRAKHFKDETDFKVVIENKFSPTSGTVEYESFFSEGEDPAKNDETVQTEAGVEDDIVPDHYYGDGKIPVFKPTMEQFESFRNFVDNINHYGMRSGIVKIIAPQEWLNELPPLDHKVKNIKIKNPIVQHINGNLGAYRQANVQKQRTYTLPEWRKLCDAADHQPPAKRGERRLGQTPKTLTRATKRGSKAKNTEDSRQNHTTSPLVKHEDDNMEDESTPAPKTEGSHGIVPNKGTSPLPVADCKGRQRRNGRKMPRRSGRDVDFIDEAVWDGFDYRIHDAEEYTSERCEELERAYWRTLTYNNPLYGADMPGSLFDDSTKSWNVAKLDNLLDCLGQKLPGVNTAYLYLGMWKSTFAWHLEDVDLYSINYIHFGAPKQWYSISQEDAPKFEKVMKNIWPQEARKCDQFLRHKTFLVSPAQLQNHGIRVNKLVHRQGEFVITFPYGYHSGYNLGYNCAESVNFATNSWLKYGKIAKKCHCIDDAVWVDVEEIERRLRGELTEDEYEIGEDMEIEGLRKGAVKVLTPPDSVDVKPRKKRQRVASDDKDPKKRIRKVNFKINVAAQRNHCIMCPNEMPTEEMLPTDNGKLAHRLCAIYTPETYFLSDPITGKETIHNIAGIPKSRLELRCNFCKLSGKGACFQCSAKKCARSYHATCAAAAGVLVEMREAWIEDAESGKPILQTHIDFRCRFHREKRSKDQNGEILEEDSVVQDFGRSLIKGDVIQMQFFRKDIFAGVVLENRLSEGMVLVNVLPKGGCMEVEWKWILAPNPNASIAGLERYAVTAATPALGGRPTHIYRAVPLPRDPFCEGYPDFTWAEFVCEAIPQNPDQLPVDTTKLWWYYLGEQSTEAIAKYSADPTKRVPCNEATFLPRTGRTKSAPKPRVLSAPLRNPNSLSHPPPCRPYHPSQTSHQSTLSADQCSVGCQHASPEKRLQSWSPSQRPTTGGDVQLVSYSHTDSHPPAPLPLSPQPYQQPYLQTQPQIQHTSQPLSHPMTHEVSILTREQQMQTIQQNQQTLMERGQRPRDERKTNAASPSPPPQAVPTEPPSTTSPILPEPQQKAPSIALDTPRTIPVSPLPVTPAATSSASPIPRISTPVQPLTSVSTS